MGEVIWLEAPNFGAMDVAVRDVQRCVVLAQVIEDAIALADTIREPVEKVDPAEARRFRALLAASAVLERYRIL